MQLKSKLTCLHTGISYVSLTDNLFQKSFCSFVMERQIVETKSDEYYYGPKSCPSHFRTETRLNRTISDEKTHKFLGIQKLYSNYVLQNTKMVSSNGNKITTSNKCCDTHFEQICGVVLISNHRYIHVCMYLT